MWPPDNPELDPVNRVVWGKTSEDDLSLQKFQACVRTNFLTIHSDWPAPLI